MQLRNLSPLTGSPRLAANPPNAILNFLDALLESEARLAAAALGLDPCMGVLHVDTTARDSLACDLMERSHRLPSGSLVLFGQPSASPMLRSLHD